MLIFLNACLILFDKHTCVLFYELTIVVLLIAH